MFYKIDHVDVEPSPHQLNGLSLRKAIVNGSCTMSRWKMVFHFTDEGDMPELNQTPLFGCKNYVRKSFHKCVPLSTAYQGTSCPIITESRDQILLQLAVFLLNHRFVNKTLPLNRYNSVFQQALKVLDSQNS